MKLSKSLVVSVCIFFSIVTLSVSLWSAKQGVIGKADNDILLIINYNHPHYESMSLIKKMYEPYFKNIVFYGPTKHPHVNELKHHMGFFSYLCISDAMKKNPNYKGYFFVMDDCIINPWTFKDFDRTKIWYPYLQWNAQYDGNPVDLTKGPNSYPTWEWLSSQWGYKPTVQAFNELPEVYKTKLEQNWGPHHITFACSDIVYIPSDYKDQYIELAELFGKHQVFLEIAVPTIMSCISSKSDWLWLEGNSTYNKACLEYNPEMPFNHPIKLSHSYKQNQSFLERLFEEKLRII